MSRIGRMPITVPAGVEISVADGNVVTVKGPKGTLTQKFNSKMHFSQENGHLTVSRADDEKETCALHGLTRTLVHNMVLGVEQGFKKELDVNGVGYRAQKDGKKLVMNLGYSHPVTMEEVDGISIECPTPNKIVISGIDKEKVGQFAANVRSKRPPEPYKCKGIKYADEVIISKEGKTGK